MALPFWELVLHSLVVAFNHAELITRQALVLSK